MSSFAQGREDERGFRILYIIKDVPFDLFPCWLSDDQLISASHRMVLTENRVPYSRMSLFQYSADDQNKRSPLMQLTSQLVSVVGNSRNTVQT